MVKIETNGKELIESLDKLGEDIDKIASRLMYRIEGKVKRQITKEGLVDYGVFRNSVRGRFIRPDTFLVSDGVKYGIYHELGTGIYGPYKKRIRPVRANALRFTPKGRSTPVYRKSVAGVPAKRPFYKAIVNMEEDLDREIKRIKHLE